MRKKAVISNARVIHSTGFDCVQVDDGCFQDATMVLCCVIKGHDGTLLMKEPFHKKKNQNCNVMPCYVI